MATLALFNSTTPYFHPTNLSRPRPRLHSLTTQSSPSVRLYGGLGRRRIRGMSVVTRAAPGPGAYLFALLVPFSLLAATIFTSIRIADKLDDEFLQELAVNQAILEAKEDDEDADEDEDDLSINEEPSRTRTRNRPKREAEVSS